MKNNRFYSNKKYSTIILLFLLSLLISILKFPNLLYEKGFGFLGFINYLFTLFILRKQNYKLSFFTGFLFGIIFLGITCYWFIYDSLLTFCIYILIYGIISAFLFLFFNYIGKKHIKSGWILQWFIACSFEYLQGKIIPEFNLLTTVYSQWEYIYIIQISKIIGINGLNFFVIFPSFFIYGIVGKILDRKNIKTNRDTDNTLYECDSYINYISKYEIQLKSTSLVFPVIFAFLWFFGLYGTIYFGIKNNQETDCEEFKNVILIQSNKDNLTDNKKIFRENLIQLMNFTDEIIELEDNVDLIVWPENSIKCNFDNPDKDDIESVLINQSVVDFFNKYKIYFLSGNNYSDNDDFFNSICFYKSASENYEYIKNILRTYNESFPLLSDFNFFNIQNEKKQYKKGEFVTSFCIDNFYFSGLLDFEDYDYGLARKMIQSGGRCFIGLNTDLKYNSKSYQYLHVTADVFRAVESEVPFLRCSDSGITCYISEKGRIVDLVESFSKTYLNVKVPILQKEKMTFFCDYGDIIGITFFIFGIVLLLIQIFIDIILKIKIKFQVEKNG